MLPVALPSQARPSLPSLLVHRLLRPSHCDYQLAWQALVQLVVSPSPARQMTLIHRQAKGRYARDDPAFLVLSVGFVAFTALVYGLIFASSIFGALGTALWAVVVDYGLLGCAIATLTWLIANQTQSKKAPHPHAAEVDHSVEWPFAWDIHCNALIPAIALVGPVQLALLPVLLPHSRLSAALSVLLYVFASVQYMRATFSGFSVLPTMENPEVFFYPAVPLAVAAFLAVLIGFNPTHFLLKYYFDRAY